MTTTLINQNGSSNKVFQIAVSRKTVVRRWGRIGARPQSKVTRFTTADAARKFRNDLVVAKLDGGYAPTFNRDWMGLRHAAGR